MQIRCAQPDEADLVGALQLRTVLHSYAHIFPPDAPVPTAQALAGHWATRVAAGTTGLIALFEGKIAGMALAGSDDHEPRCGHLSRVYVDPQHQGRGIGSQLYAACVDVFRDREFEQATLWVLERNARARAWYERLGWQTTRERKPVYPPSGIHDLRYRLTSEWGAR